MRASIIKERAERKAAGLETERRVILSEIRAHSERLDALVSAPPPAYWDDDGYIHCPWCVQRQYNKAGRGEKAMCIICETEYLQP